MPVAMLIAILVVLVGIVAVAVGRGGELSEEQPDYAPLDMGPVSATDVVLLRPPTALWGYSMQATDDALEQIAGAIRDRDVRIVALEQRIADLTTGDRYAAPPSSARHARRPSPPEATLADASALEESPSEAAEPASEAAEPGPGPVLPPESSGLTQPSPILDTGPIEPVPAESAISDSPAPKSGPDTEPIRHENAEQVRREDAEQVRREDAEQVRREDAEQVRRENEELSRDDDE